MTTLRPPPDLMRVFVAGQISTSLSQAETVDLRADAQAEWARLEAARYDQAPVSQQKRIIGWVATRHLKSAQNVRQVYKPLDRAALLSADAPLGDLLDLLGEHAFVFIVDEHGLTGFVTPSDLDRHPVRSHFYLLISGIEMLLADIIRHAVPQNDVVSRISGDDLKELWDAAHDENKETHPVEYLYLKDLAELFLASAEATSARGWDSRFANRLTEICQFRPQVMHPTRPLADHRSPATVASLARRSEELMRSLAQVRLEIANQDRNLSSDS